MLNGGFFNHHKVKNCINPNSEGRLDVAWVSEEVDCTLALCLRLVYPESIRKDLFEFLKLHTELTSRVKKL